MHPHAKCSVFIATSLDGFIARPDGSIDWLERANKLVPQGEDFGYHDFLRGVDCLVMGVNSFELVMSFPEWPYGSTPVHVLSSRMKQLPSSLPDTVTLSNEEPRQVVERLSAAGAQQLYVDGGVTIQRFLRQGLVDEMTITRIPVLLGTGRPLFGALDRDIELEHVSTRAYPFGFVQSTYRVA